ncbi:signal peptidase I [Candidatus Pacearchaeota archaeon]|nr:signal peptidase I [Candidatus Pacearchaeota archaeon]
MSLKNNLKKIWSKFWFLLWKDESFKGWLFSLVFIFIFIKFIFFPVLSLLTGTPLPLAIVESCSMYHDGNLLSNTDSWFEKHAEKYSMFEIEKNDFLDFWFEKGMNKGDILFVIGANPEKLKIGDVIIFNAEQRNPIIHRIVEIKNENNERIFSTIGDNNNGQLSFEQNINPEDILGKPILKIAPYLGWIKLVFFENSKPQSERGFCGEN